MSDRPHSPSRALLFAGCLAFYLAGGLVLRLVLLKEAGLLGSALPLLGLGLRMDLAGAFWLLLPAALWLALAPERVYSARWHRAVLPSAVGGFAALQCFLFSVELEFFREFESRFNTVAVDYLLFPREVFVNIWESYRVVPSAALALSIGVAAALLARRSLAARAPAKPRLVLAAWLLIAGTVAGATPLAARLSAGRVQGEVAGNGLLSFIKAAWTRHLDYSAYYATLPREEAYARARRLVLQPGVRFGSAPDALQRAVPGDAARPRRNVVVILVESFGSEFWGVLGNKQGLTASVDALAAEGTLFTRLYASGNRTVRGLEGVLSSMPPLPGDSIVRRSHSDRVATIARTLRDDGYQTAFYYGGRGLFDNVESFTSRNGYERFLEQSDVKDPSFTTSWGVADEDLFNLALSDMRRMHASGKPFFGTVLTVSNHKPYTYPRGRIPEDPEGHHRTNAVKYTDWAIGDFIAKARKEPFFKDTVFAVVADHGARVYGSQDIPIQSYEIPLVLFGPGVPKGRRVDVVGGSLDVAPTLLGVLGRPYDTVFFGRDLLKLKKGEGWAVMHHNRDIGMYREPSLVVLGLRKTLTHYKLDPATRKLELLEKPGPAEKELADDAQALFQVADELYTGERYLPAASGR